MSDIIGVYVVSLHDDCLKLKQSVKMIFAVNNHFDLFYSTGYEMFSIRSGARACESPLVSFRFLPINIFRLITYSIGLICHAYAYISIEYLIVLIKMCKFKFILQHFNILLCCTRCNVAVTWFERKFNKFEYFIWLFLCAYHNVIITVGQSPTQFYATNPIKKAAFLLYQKKKKNV